MIRIYQIQLTDEQIDIINELGHEAVSAQLARMNVMFGADNFRTSDLQYYTETMQVDTDDLEEAFGLTNIWNQPERVTRIGDMQSSTSVGDIFQKGDQFYMVDDFGFALLTLFNDEVETLQAA